MDDVHPILRELFDDWNTAGIVWCLLRGRDDLLAPRGDVDLLIAADDLPAARRAAERLGFVPVPGRRYGTHLLQFDRGTAHWLWLHLVTELRYGPFRALESGAEQEALDRRRRLNEIAILSPDDEFWALLLHGLLDRRTIAARHHDRLRALAPEVTDRGKLAAAFHAVAPAGWTLARVARALEERDGVALEALVPGMVAACRRRARSGVPHRVMRRLQSLGRTVRELPRRRGVSVALLGPDGAGKSTLAAGLEATSVFPVRQVYMGLTGGMLRYVDKLRVPGVVKIGRLLVIWGRYARAQYHQTRGRLVVFDRYIYDADVPTPYRLGPIRRLARWIDGRSCPPPDLVIVLDAPGEVMHRRKGEYTPEMLEEWRQRFRSVERRVPGVEIVDASQPAEAVRAEVLQRIWRRYAARWSG